MKPLIWFSYSVVLLTLAVAMCSDGQAPLAVMSGFVAGVFVALGFATWTDKAVRR